MALKGPGLRWLTASPLTSRQPRAGVTAGPRRGSWQRCSARSAPRYLRAPHRARAAAEPPLPANPRPPR